jgi:hypothetical protein
MSNERTRSGPPLWMLAALLVIVGVAWQVQVYARQQQHKQLRDGLGELQRQIEAYAVDTEGSYPPDLARFIELHKIALPQNPYGAGPIKLLKPGDPWEPGGIVYVPFGPIIAVGSNAPPNPIIPTDTDDYILVAYSPRSNKRRAAAMEEARVEYQKAMKDMDSHETTSYPLYAEGIDWEHVDVMLTAGEDYDP